ncbi:MAG: HDIG domain-containing protein [bacterium]|nr:HDIG domain-containing protein [bacterium]
MFGLGRKPSDRRRKVKQARMESSKPLWVRYRQRIGFWASGATLLFFLALSTIALYGKPPLRYRPGQTIDGPVFARISFSQIDEQETSRAREAAKAATPSYYRVNRDLVARIGGDLQDLYQAAKGAEEYEAFAPLGEQNGWKVNPGAFDELRSLSDEAGGSRYAKWLTALKQRLYEEYTVRPTSEEDRNPSSNSPVARVLPLPAEGAEGEPPGDTTASVIDIPTVQLIPTSNPRIIEARAETLAARTFPLVLRPAVAAVLAKHLAAEPVLLFDKAATATAMESAFDRVDDVIIAYPRGASLVTPPPGEEQTVLAPEQAQLLELEHRAYLDVLADPGNATEGAKLRRERVLAQVGTAAILAVLTVALFAYVRQFQARILQVRTRTVAFAVLLLAVVAATRLIRARFDYPEVSIGPMLLAAAILIIAYPQRFASGVGAITALLLVVVVRGDVAMLLLLATGSTIVNLTLVNIRTRTRIVVSGLLVGTGLAVICLASGLTTGQPLDSLLRRAALAAGTALLAAMIIQASLPFIERVFRIATPLTLQEWGDATKPLLQRLAHEAPGTYNHSLVLGTMAESACESIGANGLLARVGALYHDVGKVLKKDYFAENQEASINRHDKLSPTMSLLIIVGHVKDGIEMAKEYGLPRILRQFIDEHHGTTVVRYFHHAASEKQPQISSGKHDRQVPDTEFRYPGPKPRSRESAILMLCDGVEGAVRALAEPTAGRIENIVHTVLVDRLNDGQFDDCEITLRELHRVEQSLVKSLCRFYHGRVAYPTEGSKPGKPSEAEPVELSAG